MRTINFSDFAQAVIEFMNGKFGKYRLKKNYRSYWKMITWGVTSYLFVKFIMFPFFSWWEGVVNFLNYVI